MGNRWALEPVEKPRVPRSLLCGGIRGMLGIVSPSRVARARVVPTDEDHEYFNQLNDRIFFEFSLCVEDRKVTRKCWRLYYREVRRRCKKTGNVVDWWNYEED